MGSGSELVHLHPEIPIYLLIKCLITHSLTHSIPHLDSYHAKAISIAGGEGRLSSELASTSTEASFAPTVPIVLDPSTDTPHFTSHPTLTDLQVRGCLLFLSWFGSCLWLMHPDLFLQSGLILQQTKWFINVSACRKYLNSSYASHCLNFTRVSTCHLILLLATSGYV